jgi:uncharacterized protein YjbI with pentapeptide repeats
MPACKGKLNNGEPCPKTVRRGQKYCRWHDPGDESWREIYVRLEKASPEEKTDIVLKLIENHPEHRLVLSERGGQKANLISIDLSIEALEKKRILSGVDEPSWWYIGNSRHGANLFLAELQGADLSAANLQGAFLAGANLQGATLEFAKLQGASFGDPFRHSVQLFRVNLQNASLKYSDLNKAYLYGANLQEASLFEANLQGAVLIGANLQKADLMNSDLRNAHLNGANLKWANLGQADLQETHLGGAILSEAYLHFANLQNADLVLANLQGAQLNSANLHDADLMDANLQGANLSDAKLQNVDLTIVKSISNVFMSGAWLDRTRIRQEQIGDAIMEEKERDYASAKYGYLALKQNFDDIGDYTAASWAYRKERRMKKLEAQHNGRDLFSEHEWKKGAVSYLKFFSDTLIEWLCDYGESVWRIICWMIILLLVIGPILFTITGGFVWPKDLYNNYFSLSSFWLKFWFSYRLCLLYTVDAFITANFSGLQPSNETVKLASGFFSFAGVFLVGLLGFVAGNRIRRS